MEVNNPTLVFKILFPSTERIDRILKPRHYTYAPTSNDRPSPARRDQGNAGVTWEGISPRVPPAKRRYARGSSGHRTD